MQPTDEITVVRSSFEVAGDEDAELRIDPGTRIGRYVVLESLGGGAMGVVVAAHDPDLQRRVAIKLVRPWSLKNPAEAQARLFREAQAMAALEHPNVITVHDVGTFGEQVFIAMELVEGQTLRDWIEDGPRPLPAILEAFAGAGAGLHAAHRAGVVHRDFKPDNVMVQTDEQGHPWRVLVLDFGLARLEEHSLEGPSAPDWTDPSMSMSMSSSGSGSASLTRTGSVMGTPAYMAPEQYTGDIAGSAADQYAFCIALFEAIYGYRPFGSDDVRALAKAKARGFTGPLPSAPALPHRVQQVLRRGLSPRPEDRLPDMERLVAALRLPTAPRRGRPWIAGGLGCAAAAIIGLSVQSTPDPCERAGEAVAQAWSETRQYEAEAAFEATGLSYAGDTWRSVHERIDAYAGELLEARRRTCEAMRASEAGTPTELDRTAACLDRATDQLRSWVHVLQAADGSVVENAEHATIQLMRLQQCDRAGQGTVANAETHDPARSQARAAIDRARAKALGGQYQAALDELQAHARDVQATGDPWLAAQLQLVRGQALHRLTSHDAAVESFLAAVAFATEAEDTELEAKAWTELAFTTAAGLGELDRARAHLRSAQAAAARIDASAELQAKLLWVEANLLHEEGRYDEALAVLQQALAMPEQDMAARIMLRSVLSRVLVAQGQFEQAESTMREALEQTEEFYGAKHPQVARASTYLGQVLHNQGRHEAALPLYESALKLQIETLGDRALEVGFSHNNIAGLLGSLGEHEAALKSYQQARAIVTERVGPQHVNVGKILYNAAELHKNMGHHQRAIDQYREAIDVFVVALGPEHPNVGQAHNNLGAVLYDTKHYDEAAEQYRRSLQILEATLGPDHVALAYPLVGIGQSELGRDDVQAAVQALERALALRQDPNVDPVDRADAEFALAQALWEAGEDRSRALQLTRQALGGYAEAPKGLQTATDHAKAWLQERT